MTNWLSPDILIGLVTLTALEIILGIDNVVFISIVAGKLPPAERRRAWNWGLLLALIPRLLLLVFIRVLLGLTEPVVTLFGPPVESNRWCLSGKDLMLVLGGIFLIFKATREIHNRLEGEEEAVDAKGSSSFWSTIAQIMVLNVVFSIDSLVTAIGMTSHVGVMGAAVVISTLMMLVVAGAVGGFVERHPTVKMLALSFLVLIGVNLLGEGFGQHIPKGYTYFAMAFSVAVEMINLRLRARKLPELSATMGASPGHGAPTSPRVSQESPHP